MITWMQKHKKWLVITIWISTIAFVGAGFVGWGSYDYNQKGGVVAVVGDREIAVDEYQREYSELYSQYSQMFGEQFNQEMAKQLKLSDLAYNLVIQKNLILSYADDLNLDVTDEEVVSQLVKMNAFLKDGKFNKEIYLKVLAQNRTSALEYESSLKRNLLLQKVQNLFQIEPEEAEVKLLNRLMFLEDNVSIKIIDLKNINVSIDEIKLKEFWEKNKDSYKSENSYDLAIETLAFSKNVHSTEDMNSYFNKFKLDFKKEDGKLKSFTEAKEEIQKALDEKTSKKIALKKYLKLKKDQEKFSVMAVVYEDKLTYSNENILKIKQAKKGDVLKPFKNNNEFVTIKVLNSFLPKTLSYEKAKTLLRNDFIAKQRLVLLQEQVKTTIKTLSSKDSITLTRASITSVKGLNPQEGSTFLNQLFSSVKKEGSILIGDKTVIYKINSSKLAPYDESKDLAVRTTLGRLQNSELMTNLVKRLENTYDVQSTSSLKE